MAHTNLHNFAGGDTDGASPQGSLTLIDPTLYGMTEFGGSANKGTLTILPPEITGVTVAVTPPVGASSITIVGGLLALMAAPVMTIRKPPLEPLGRYRQTA